MLPVNAPKQKNKMYLLDTDTITHLHSGNLKVKERLIKLDDPEVGITIITQVELLRGRFEFLLKAANSSEILRAQELLRTQTLLTNLLIVPFNEASVSQFDRLKTTKGLSKIGHADLLTASTALANRLLLLPEICGIFAPFLV